MEKSSAAVKHPVISDTTNNEVPNTSGVVIWPDKILNEIKMLEQYDRVQRRKAAQQHATEKENIPVEDDFLVEKLGLSERFEFYMLLTLVAFLWWGGSYYLLKLHKFPFHKHYFEALAIFLCPVIFIVVMFIVIDKIYDHLHRSKEKKDL